MKINSTLTTTSCLFVLLQLGGQAHAEVKPQVCYDLEPAQYEQLVYLDGKQGKMDQYQQEAYNINITKLKKVHFLVRASKDPSDNIITFDASGSSVPSNKPQYIWISDGTFGFAHNDSSKATNTLEYSKLLSGKFFILTVKDPVCNVSSTEQLPYYNLH